MTTRVRVPEIHPGIFNVTNHQALSIRIKEEFPFSIFDQNAGHHKLSVVKLSTIEDTGTEVIFLIAGVRNFLILSLTIARDNPLNILVSVAN